MSLQARRIAVFVIVFVVVLAAGVSIWIFAEPLVGPTRHIERSDRPDGKTVAAFELRTWEEIARLAEMGDFRRFPSISERGDVFFLDPGTAVRVIERDGYFVRVEILDGQYARRRAWIPADQV